MDPLTAISRVRLDPSVLLQYPHGADTHLATCLTFYLLSIELLGVGALVLLKQAASPRSLADTRVLSMASTVSLFMALCVHAFAMGWVHEYYSQWDNTEPPKFFKVYDTAIIALAVASCCAFFIAETLRKNKGFGARDETAPTVEKILHVMVMVVTLVIVLFCLESDDPTDLDDKALVAYIFYGCMVLYLLLISAMDIITNADTASGASRFFVTGLCTYGLGLVLQLLLAPICAHENASESMGCPLPDAFNHNALFNLLQMVGYLIVGRGAIAMVDEDAEKEA